MMRFQDMTVETSTAVLGHAAREMLRGMIGIAIIGGRMSL